MVELDRFAGSQGGGGLVRGTGGLEEVLGYVPGGEEVVHGRVRLRVEIAR